MVKKYNVILADCPWHYSDRGKAGRRGADQKYPVLNVDELGRLPVAQIAEENAALFMWATFPNMPAALKVMEAWGFEYKTAAFLWIKTNKVATTQLFMGLGRYTRANGEACLIGIRGKMIRQHAGIRQIIEAANEPEQVKVPVRGHSQKPTEVHSRILQLYPDGHRIELFARERISGWCALGYDVDGLDISESLHRTIEGKSTNESKQTAGTRGNPKVNQAGIHCWCC